MLLVCGDVDCNGHAALRLYKKSFPHKCAPYHTAFSSVNRKLHETGCFSKVKMNRERTIRTPYSEERLLSNTEGDPSISTPAISKQVRFSHTSVWKILSENKMIPYHLESVQKLQPVDYPHRKTFAEWYLRWIARNNTFAASVLFTDEATFTKEGAFNTHNAHVWASANPHDMRISVAQRRIFFNVWAGIIGDYLIRPCIHSTLPFGRKDILNILATSPAGTSGSSTFSSFVALLYVVPAQWGSSTLYQ